METKATGWTPGPWKLGKCRDGAAGIWSESGHFADVFYNPEDDDGGELNVEDDHRAMAAIRLICAAPDMAELLAEMAEDDRVPCEYAEEIDALLAKIRGESNA